MWGRLENPLVSVSREHRLQEGRTAVGRPGEMKAGAWPGEASVPFRGIYRSKSRQWEGTEGAWPGQMWV